MPNQDPLIHYNLRSYIDLNSPRPMNLNYAQTHVDPGVSIELNPQGWRSPHDFDTLDWNSSILMFGCSHVWGQGLNYEETAGHLLEQLTGRPVINLGIMGSGPKFAIETAVQLQTIYGPFQPRAVVHIWSHYLRRCYQNERRPDHGHIWEQEPDSPVSLEQLNFEAQHWHQLWPIIWPASTRVDRTFFSDTHHLLGMHIIPTLDRARDGAHPGILTNQHLAQDLYQAIQA